MAQTPRRLEGKDATLPLHCAADVRYLLPSRLLQEVLMECARTGDVAGVEAALDGGVDVNVAMVGCARVSRMRVEFCT